MGHCPSIEVDYCRQGGESWASPRLCGLFCPFRRALGRWTTVCLVFPARFSPPNRSARSELRLVTPEVENLFFRRMVIAPTLFHLDLTKPFNQGAKVLVVAWVVLLFLFDVFPKI